MVIFDISIMNIILQVHSKMIGHFGFFEQIKNIKVAISSANTELAPADKKLYYIKIKNSIRRRIPSHRSRLFKDIFYSQSNALVYQT